MENKAIIKWAFSNGYAKIQVKVSDMAFLNLKINFPTCSQYQHKSKPEKEMTFLQLRDNLIVLSEVEIWTNPIALTLSIVNTTISSHQMISKSTPWLVI